MKTISTWWQRQPAIVKVLTPLGAAGVLLVLANSLTSTPPPTRSWLPQDFTAEPSVEVVEQLASPVTRGAQRAGELLEDAFNVGMGYAEKGVETVKQSTGTARKP